LETSGARARGGVQGTVGGARGPGPGPVLEWRRQDGLVVVVLLLLAQDLQLQEELLLLKQPGVVGVHLRLVLLPFLIGGDVLVVLQLLYPGLGVFALLAAVFVVGILGMALLFSRKREERF